MANADRIIELLHEAKGRAAGAERERFLAEACRDDAALKEQLVSLLKADANEGDSDFLKNALLLRPTAPVTEKPGDRIGRYKLLEQIGEGGCGVVYMAEQQEPVRRRVALKVIKLGMDTKQVIARFEAERQALALMDHPNIAKVLDAGATETGRPYFVMELVRGIKITDYCDESQVSTENRLKLFIQVCQAIQHAHQKGVIHRDIKPSNILVTINDGVPVPKVIDFGIAKATQGRLTDRTLFTAFEQFIGTPAYMSPEQAAMTSLDIDTRSDIYSLGVLLYELLTGRTPFDQKELLAAGLDEMRRTILEKEPPKPSTRLNTMAADALTLTANHHHTDAPKLIHLVGGDLDWIVMKALDKNRARRYETANGLATDINRHLNNEPVLARPPSRWYEFQKTVRRHKFGFSVAAVLIGVLTAGVMISTQQAIRAVRAEQEQARLLRVAEAARDSETRLRQQAEAEAIRAKRAEEEQARLRQEAEAARAKEMMLRERSEYGTRILEAQEMYAAGRKEEAKERLDQIHPELFEPPVEQIPTRRSIAWEYAREAHLSNALENLEFVVQHDSSRWTRQIATDHYHYSTVAVVANDRAAYEKYRRELVKDLDHTNLVEEADFLLRLALLTPADSEFIQSLSPFVRTAMAGSRDDPAMPQGLKIWHRLVLGLVAFRGGDNTNALNWIDQSLALANAEAALEATARAIKAMPLYQTGQVQDARMQLDLAKNAVESVLGGRFPPDNPSLWCNWQIARIYADEAEKMIGSPSVPPK